MSGITSVQQPNTELAVLSWPIDAGEVSRLGRLGIPRLVLVPPDIDPPPDTDPLLDWVRTPADEREVASRAVALVRRAASDRGESPRVDAHDRLLHGGVWVGLSPIEARLARALCERYTEVVGDDHLLKRAWPEETDNGGRAAALRVHLTRLRQRIAPLGLEIRALRSQGMILQPRPRLAGSPLPRSAAD